MNTTGIVAALAIFLGIWLGHVGVRKIEFISPTIWLPATLAALSGLMMLAASLFTAQPALSAACGILGITLLWDGFEFIRQQRRICKGHAPANPHNPRHARILAQHPAATPLDLPKRDPVGRPVGPEEAIQLILNPRDIEDSTALGYTQEGR